MPLFNKKTDDAQAVKQKPAAPTSRYEFIPYHGHYNAHTLITKNGELLQTIRIDGNLAGAACENVDGIHATVREAIRQAIGHIDSEDFAFWLHTVRTREPLQHTSRDAGGFAGYVNSAWEQSQHFDARYRNSIYLTILRDGQAAPLVDKKNTKHILFPKQNRAFRNRFLDASYDALDAVTNNVLASLRTQCSAARLGLSERDGLFYSEPMEFIGQLVNLRAEPCLLPDVNLSVGVEKAQLAFGFNGVEARHNITGAKRFAALLSLKQYRDIPVETADHVLQAPMEMIVSQSIKFMPAVHALKHYRAQKELFEMSGDVVSNDTFGVSDMLASNQKSATDFSEHQTTFMLMVDNAQTLDAQVELFQHSFTELGLVTVREDIKLEECFWSQLPGNFHFIRRRDTLATQKSGGFCRLNRFPDGQAEGNHWGSCLSLIPTIVGSPYCFNFHAGDNGHTVLFDFNSFGDRAGKVLEYFLLTQTQKHNARIVLFDRHQSARLLMNKMEGGYFTLTQLAKASREHLEDTSPRLALNPFTLDDSPRNQSFLVAWCGLLLSPDAPLEEPTRATLRQAIAELYNLPAEERHLPGLTTIITQLDPSLGELLADWHSSGKYSGLFDFATDTLDMNRHAIGFDLTPAIVQPAFLLPLFSYLLHRVIGALDGSPTVIVLNEAWNLLENPFFAPRLESLMDMLREHNAMLLCTTQTPAAHEGSATLATLLSACATTLYIPDDVPLTYIDQPLNLSPHDALILLSMDRQKGDFLVKQKDESVGLRLHINSMEDAMAIFTGDIKALASAHGRFASVPKDY